MSRFIILISLFFPFQSLASAFEDRLIAAAESQIGKTVSYDPEYRAIGYPMGDVPLETGVCSDVVIRAYRTQGIDLQQKVHEDMKENFDLYPKKWHIKTTDRNIDHRRVPNLQTFFKRHGTSLPKNSDFKPGDIVTWNLSITGEIPHIGLIAKENASDGTPLVIHNIGKGTQKENILFKYTVTGHYRYGPEN